MAPENEPPPGLMAGQALHFAALAALLALTAAGWGWLGRPAPVAFGTAVAMPIAHQLFVWLAWRTELGSKAVSRTIGFGGYMALFFLLFGGRFVTLLWLAWIDRGSLGLPSALAATAGVLLAMPGVYTMHSVARYFGFARAAGADHFDERYRTMPLVRRGVFRYTSNGMYAVAFLLFWAIALGFNSSAALVVAAFSHAYIWVHYYATERPDMAWLYGRPGHEG
ncbi:hypothetical protein Mal64_29660 [Pseudobythopirellula maris]|uniref:Steroid 5-alpha reductase C-terminal domain-containing protein n=1 Tax=Pseudobythopirellula maris TaxID=2527991 RepID=A0A5C5ZK52_9BACT|nr:methyltransferase [Pseudobythopirellula maris]TWT87427.1 hypothetical protein Mal64_29660 [Pseudobythopirellula maris]